ncbi:MAG: hypothetical protein HOM34_10195 [Planctomycetes bacterium]|jgi:hypothetical protein|nr:hypothetical protein [Planctomycetota bacterium]MBT4028120.1 hypothetical protein [Planctomycetota bacterium]MBT4560756.1 hypothetical protein [Planctomycetota bacterium]MBT5101799.1 hypothetical protein [Planctomycetota bacterium]MBT5121080.1 hypothetical protein [Planctomycetota bacterium]
MKRSLALSALLVLTFALVGNSTTPGAGNGPQLKVTNLIAGQTASARVNNATPLKSVSFFYTSQGVARTRIQHPTANIVLELAHPRFLGKSYADANGTASLSFSISSKLVGRTMWLQAVGRPEHHADLFPRTQLVKMKIQ